MTWLPPSLMSGQEIYDNFQKGPGTEGISSSADMVNQLAGRHQARVEELTALRSLMESAWQGEAAGEAQRGLGPLVSEHEKSGQALFTAQDLTGRQAGSFGDAKNGVVPVPPAPGEVDPLVVLTNPGATVTHYQQVTEHSRAAQHNVDVMNGYGGASQYNTDGQPATFGELVDDQAGMTVDRPDTSGSTTTGSPQATVGREAPVAIPGIGRRWVVSRTRRRDRVPARERRWTAGCRERRPRRATRSPRRPRAPSSCLRALTPVRGSNDRSRAGSCPR